MKVAVCEDQPEVQYTLSKILSELPMVKKVEAIFRYGYVSGGS